MNKIKVNELIKQSNYSSLASLLYYSRYLLLFVVLMIHQVLLMTFVSVMSLTGWTSVLQVHNVQLAPRPANTVYVTTGRFLLLEMLC